MAGIEVFTPSVRQIVIDGTAIAIGPFKARQFSAVQKAMRPIAAVIEASPDKLIADNMAATVLRKGWVQLAITGADRIAINGDAANKIGTFGLALICRAHGHEKIRASRR